MAPTPAPTRTTTSVPVMHYGIRDQLTREQDSRVDHIRKQPGFTQALFHETTRRADGRRLRRHGKGTQCPMGDDHPTSVAGSTAVPHITATVPARRVL
jgi:hypothetical protein